MTETRNYILSAATAARMPQRMAYEIVEQNIDEPEMILAGIQENGVVMAQIIARHLQKIYKGSIKVIEITLNKRKPQAIQLSEEMSFDNTVVILIDDVTNSGLTLLYALKPFLQYHPRKIQTLTMVERSHKLFPIASDYVGISLASTLQEHIFVEVEAEQVVGAYLV